MTSWGAALNDSGQVIAVRHYSPYGKADYSWGSMPTSFNYTGQRLDSQTGLLYYNFRSYDPVSGRFVRADTKQNNAGGMDPYAYVGDNPETRNDPTGHCWPWCTAILGAVIGAVVGTVVSVAQQASSGKPIDWGAVAGAATAGALVGAAVGAVGPVAAAGFGIGGIAGAGTAVAMGAAEIGEAALSAFSLASGVAGIGAAVGNANSGACSFLPSTPVTTKDGKKPIGTLHTGESVLAYNPKTHKMELQPILQVWVHADHDLVDVTLTSIITQQGGKVHQQKEVLHTTSEHPFLTKEKGFVPAGQLKPGMHVLRADGSFGVVTGWKRVAGTAVMYNLTVQQDHTFVVGADEWVVHNTCLDPQAILTRLQKELQTGRGTANYPYRKQNGQATNSLSELYDSNGKLVATGMSDSRKTDDIFGDVQCSEGNCLINGRPLVRGETYRLFTAQIKGLPACSACQEDLQIAADRYGITINVYSIDADGNVRPVVVYSPTTPTNPLIEEEERFEEEMDNL